MPRSALIIKLGAIGDVVMALPAVHLLYEKGFQVDWICGESAFPLLEGYSWLNALPVNDSAILKGSLGEMTWNVLALWGRLPKWRYDLCATLYFDRRYRFLTAPIIARKRVSLSHVQRNRTFVPGRHHTDEYARVLLENLDLGTDSYTPNSLSPVRPDQFVECPLPAKRDRCRIALVPGGARNIIREDALRRWPLEKYVELASVLLREGYEVILVGGKDDNWVESSFASLPVTNMVGSLSLPELLALFDETDVVVSHDTGPLHIAGVTKAGVIGIFGPTNPSEKLPRRDRCIALWGGGEFACRPCYDGRNYAPCEHNGCMLEVTPIMVFQAIGSLLDQKADGRSSRFRILSSGDSL